MGEIFSVKGFSFTYSGQKKPALDGIDLEIEQGGFLVVCGLSGSGKSTLLRQLKPMLAPYGERVGQVLYRGRPIDALGVREQAEEIGFVGQSPENQGVADKVWHELAFGLECLGWDSQAIRRRVAEIAGFFGMEDWFTRNVTELSGGQRQLLNLAAAMAPQPSVLIMDEPTGQLDPVAAANLLGAAARVNREMGVTVVVSEHRLEEVLPLADAVAVLDQGRLICLGPPREAVRQLREHPMFQAMPAAARIWGAVDGEGTCPVTVGEGREWLEGFLKNGAPVRADQPEAGKSAGEMAAKARGVSFQYGKDGARAVKDITITVEKGRLLALLGGNGAGKTTLLKLLAGVLAPECGKVERTGKAALLPQEPKALLVKKTLRADLLEAGEEIQKVVELCGLEGLLDRHPYDLSGGEQQRAALAKLLLTDPDILLLDEPTKGMDRVFQQKLGEILEELLAQGKTVVTSSHDMDFCAKYAHQCALLFRGELMAQGSPEEFFTGGSFYTTAANRIARNVLPWAVTPEQVVDALQKKTPGLAGGGGHGRSEPVNKCKGEKPYRRSEPQEKTGEGGTPQERGSAEGEKNQQKKRKLPRRTVFAAGLLLLAVPLTLYLGPKYLGNRAYYATSLLVLGEGMLPFFLVFEGRKPQARELAVLAVLCALGVAGRAALVMVPQFKPVLAIAAAAGAAFGGEAGFLVGAVTMLVSNLFYSQGPWTPWQMFAMGASGFLMGAAFQKGRWRHRLAFSALGALVTVVVYGGLMNLSSALAGSSNLTWGVALSYFASGFPYDCIHGAATFVFLWFGGRPLLEKLERVKEKYG